MTQSTRALPPITLWLGLGLVLVAEGFLFVDVQSRGWATVPEVSPDALVEPAGWIEHGGRFVAVNMTPLCWLGCLLVFDGLLTTLDRRRIDHPAPSPIRVRPNRFLVAWLTSIPVWAVFDTLNFYYLDAWHYHGLPGTFASRVLGYFIAFAAISPGMFLAAQLAQQAGLGKLTIRDAPRAGRLAWLGVVGPPTIVAGATLVLLGFQPGELGSVPSLVGSGLLLFGPGLASFIRNRTRLATSLGIGAGFTLWAGAVRDPIACMTLWVGLVYLLDPLVAKVSPNARRAPSLLRDWEAGRWGRTGSLMVGGGLCGLLWEFWNYWAIAKWTYNLPFLGQAQHWAYFEMPILGFLGFLPFACECWVMLNLIIAGLERCRLPVAEALASDEEVL